MSIINDRIKRTMDSLKFVYQTSNPIPWRSESFSKLDMTTGVITENIDEEVPDPTGFYVKTGLIDVSKFVWGIGNYSGVLVCKEDNIFYFNSSNKFGIENMGQRYVNNTRVLGDGTKYYPLLD